MQSKQTQTQTQGKQEQAISWSLPPIGHYNEAYDTSGLPRTHWEYLLNSLDALGTSGLQDRYQKASRILRDDGATYNLISDPLGKNRWELDPIPMLISSGEWSQVEQGLIERAELLNLVLKDIYGPQELIRQGVIPPEIIYSHPGFLRQCKGITMPGEHCLTLHAADMVRGPDGNMIIIGDRTQAPSGAGYALENRTVLSRVMPSLFRDSHVHRLALFFQSLRATLSTLSPTQGDDPQIVILTPGAYSETYFEHTYLSNYLGYPLVQGSDLTVRDGHVWLKSLNGLRKVDVILRRVDDSYCDPVELKSDSYLGIPGLVEVVRAGNVVVSNPLGSGILETPALLKFMPAISQHFFGHELKIPSVDTWWCGDPQDMQYIRDNIDTLIIKPAMRQTKSPSIHGHTLSDIDKQNMFDRIAKAPYSFVAQSYISPSYIPAWQEQQLKTRPSIFRTFTVASESTYAVMAGGLTRVGLSGQDSFVSNQVGSQSKDTWILASEPEKQISLVDDRTIAQESNLPSRVVENLFWLGRYAERAESTIRLIRTVFMQLNSIDPLPINSKNLLLQALSKQTNCLPGFMGSQALLNQDQELISLILDTKRPDSIKSCLLAVLTCSEEVKEMLSADTHRIVNDLRDNLYDLERAYVGGMPTAPEEALDPLVTTLLALSGLSHESMLRGIGWKFQEIGRRVERSLQTSRLIQSLLTPELPNTDQPQMLEAVLLSVEALITFRRRYRTYNDIAHGLELLMQDETNPRSVFFQIKRLQTHFEELPQAISPHSPGLNPAQKTIIQALNAIQLADLDNLANIDSLNNKRVELDRLLAEIIKQVEAFSILLSEQYFDHSAGPQQLAETQGITFI
ncbi:circularly permuted type 2 ATP-grasp protein [Neptuniibacter pectenicola]|uniref:Circularly permuted type 2 ATP-grasp protein n=1 Tax=Neptuniibacter pectenicola TaxID=1806669 RepID=A0ABU9TR58_9GAMM|nr:circularly permuted type 2 ATP-grasp protein [Neptuniibacter pectenicola]